MQAKLTIIFSAALTIQRFSYTACRQQGRSQQFVFPCRANNFSDREKTVKNKTKLLRSVFARYLRLDTRLLAQRDKMRGSLSLWGGRSPRRVMITNDDGPDSAFFKEFVRQISLEGCVLRFDSVAHCSILIYLQSQDPPHSVRSFVPVQLCGQGPQPGSGTGDSSASRGRFPCGRLPRHLREPLRSCAQHRHLELTGESCVSCR